MRVYDIFALSLKNVKIDKIRTVLVSVTIGLGVFLILIFSVMQNSAVEIEKMKSENNPEYRKVTILSLQDSNRKNYEAAGIDVYSLADITQMEHVKSVHLVNEFTSDDSDTVNYLSDQDLLKSRIGEAIWIDGIEIKSPEKKLWTAFDKFNPFDLTKIELAQMVNDSFSVYKCGRPLSNESNKLEVIMDDVTAYRFSRSKGLSITRNEAISRLLNKNISFFVNGQVINAVIVGIYDYKSYMSRPLSESLEDKQLMDAFENIVLDDEELNGSTPLTHADICFPIFMNENLRRVIEEVYTGKNNGVELALFQNYQGRVEVVVDNITNLESVTNRLKEKYSYFVTSKQDQAKTAINRMFFFKRIIMLIGIIIAVIALLSVINTMFMVIDERQHYIGVLMSTGYSKASVIKVITSEAVWFGIFGNMIGILLTVFAKEIFSLLIHKSLHEAELYKYVSIELNGRYILITVVISICITYFAGLLPAIKGSKRNPVDLLNA